jgi:hypothetical protein
MSVTVKIEFVDELVVIEPAVRAEENKGFLLVYDKDGTVAAKFSLSKVEHWWTGNARKPERF